MSCRLADGTAQVHMESKSSVKAGLVMTSAAIVLWSTSASSTFWLTRHVGAWQFLVLTSGIGGLVQTLCYIGMGRPLRAILLPPPKLWALALVTFVAYLVAYTVGMTLAGNASQAVGVALANFLWPTTTILLSVLWVPGTKMSGRLGAAIILSVSGLAVAKWQTVAQVAGFRGADVESLAPFLLGLVAAVLWGAYSALTARWRDWASRYASAPLGFLLTALVAGACCLVLGDWRPMSPAVWVVAALAGLLPQAAGYMLWELALHRAPPHVMGLMASIIPVLSTLSLLAVAAIVPELGGGHADYPALLAGSLLISLGVIIGAYRPRR